MVNSKIRANIINTGTLNFSYIMLIWVEYKILIGVIEFNMYEINLRAKIEEVIIERRVITDRF